MTNQTKPSNPQKPMVMVCIASAQTMQNLLPVLYLQPKKLYVICSAHATAFNSFNYLKQTILDALPATQIEKIDLQESAPNWAQVQAFAMPCFKFFQDKHAHERLVLNLTGGTKIMSAAIHHCWNHFGLEAFYVHTGQHVKFEWIHQNKSQEQVYQKQSPLLNVSRYFTTNGYALPNAKQLQADNNRQTKQAQARQTIINALAQYASSNSNNKNYFGLLNQAATKLLGNKKTSLTITMQGHITAPCKPLYDKLADAGLLHTKAIERHQKKRTEFTFKDEASIKFLGGFWVEDYLNLILKALETEKVIAPGCWHCGLNIKKAHTQKNQPAKNELDAVIISRNRLLIIECKSAHLENQDPINKLLMLKNQGGGTFGEAWILSAKNPTEGFTNRADIFNLNVLSMGAFADIKQTLKAWILGLNAVEALETNTPKTAFELAMEKAKQ